jgi:hypothetical protein
LTLLPSSPSLGFWAHYVTKVPQLALLRLGIQQCRSFDEVFLIHDIIAVKHRSCFSAPNLHDRFFVNTQTPKITPSSSPEIVYQTADVVVQVARATLTTVRCHSPITDAARHPAKPNIAAHSVPSFPEIANDLSVFTCKHTVIRSSGAFPSMHIEMTAWTSRVILMTRASLVFRRTHMEAIRVATSLDPVDGANKN